MLENKLKITNEIELEIQSLKSINKLTMYDKLYKKYVKVWIVKESIKEHIERIRNFLFI